MGNDAGKQEQLSKTCNSPSPPADAKSSRKWPIYKSIQSIKRVFDLSVDWLNRHEGSINGISALVTGVSTAFIALLTSSIATDSGRQAEIIGTQLKLLQLDERPWISITAIPTPAAPLMAIDSNILLTGMNLSFKNVGKSPAREVNAYGRIITENISAINGLFTSQRRICDPLRQDYDLPQGAERLEFTMFPGEAYTRSVDLSTENNMASPSILKDNMFIAIGCIDYKFMGQPDHHQTAFVFDLRRSNGSGSINLAAGQQLMPGEFKFVFDIAGNGPAD